MRAPNGHTFEVGSDGYSFKANEHFSAGKFWLLSYPGGWFDEKSTGHVPEEIRNAEKSREKNCKVTVPHPQTWAIGDFKTPCNKKNQCDAVTTIKGFPMLSSDSGGAWHGFSVMQRRDFAQNSNPVEVWQ